MKIKKLIEKNDYFIVSDFIESNKDEW
jgi:hypothetical protein